MPRFPLFACASLAAAVSAAEFHVAEAGSDTAAGDAGRPFATLERAQAAVRAAGSGPHRVIVGAGTYRLARTFALDDRDSGTTYQAAAGAEVRWSGSRAIPVSAVVPVTDPAIRERLRPDTRDGVRQIDLRALGITDFGAIGPRGFRRPYIPAPLELIAEDVPLTLARWPNAGEPGEPIGKVLDKGPVTRQGEKPTRGGRFTFASDRPLGWLQADEVWISGLFENGYADSMVQVRSIDPAAKVLTTVQPHMYGFASGQPWNRWVAANLLEEIDVPGEYMADRGTGRLYFLPPPGPAPTRLEVTLLAEPLVAIEGARGVVLDGMILENARGMGVYIEGGADNRVQNATLRNLGMVAVCIGKGIAPDPDYQHGFTGVPVSRALGSWHEHLYDNTTFNREAGTNQVISRCHIHHIGAGAISLGGGDRKSLTPAGNAVEDCDIHDFNRWDRTYKAAVNIDGVGNRVAHNRIHEAPGVGLYLHGNDHVIEYNEVFRVMLDGDDMGAFYMGRDPSERGTVIRYNFWHDLAREHKTFALYLDDYAGDGTRIHGNVFSRAGTQACIVLNNSSQVVVDHNLFIDCPTVFRTTGRVPFRVDLFRKRFAEVGWDSPVWTARYPDFAGYFAGEHPRGNRLEGNVELKGDDPRLVRDAQGRFGFAAGADLGIADFPAIPFTEIGPRGRP